MCGLAGIVDANGLHPDDAARVVEMRDVLAHRGPDQVGLYADEASALGHRRLSIVDLATGDQPLANEDRSIWIAYNGEIDNHLDLRRELEAAGHRYASRSDTETVVHGYEQWGEGVVERLRGMFAFAIWDSRRRRLLLARDRLGVKPIYWTLSGSKLIFASEIKAILASGLVRASADCDRFPELLATRSLAGPGTLFAGIERLEPGCILSFERGAVSLRKYWDVPHGTGRSAAPRTFESATARFSELLEESVRLRLMSDVPLGMFLSGGLDSSVIAALMARMIDRPLQTFSVAFAERAFSELSYSREVARHIGAIAHEVVVGEEEFFEAMPRLVWHEDEPMAHPSSVPLYFVSALARRHVKVVLTGEGSDELLAGYGRYPRSLLNWRAGGPYQRMVPAAARRLVKRAVGHLPGRAGRIAKRSFLAVDRTPAAIFYDNFAAVPLSAQRHLLARHLTERSTAEAAYGPLVDRLETARDSPLLERLLYVDLKTYLVELLMKQDQMSMAASIESRVPFLDHHLVEFAAGLPVEWKLSGFTTKRILRAAARTLLPRAILDRPKMGFPVPFGRWMRGGSIEIARSVLLDTAARKRGIFDPPAVERLLSMHHGGEVDAGDIIWSLMNLELWHRTFIDGDGIQVLPSPGRSTGFPAFARPA